MPSPGPHFHGALTSAITVSLALSIDVWQHLCNSKETLWRWEGLHVHTFRGSFSSWLGKWFPLGHFSYCFCGFLLGWASRYLRILTRYLTSPEDDGHLHNFEHGVLNLPLDRYCMWMNMGYWAVSRSFFCLRSHPCGGLMYLLGNGQLRRGM